MINKPIWIKTDKHQQLLEELNENFQAVKDAENEIEMFMGRHEEDDSNFIIYFNVLRVMLLN